MHVDRNPGREVAAAEAFLRQHGVEDVGTAAAEFLRRRHVGVAGGLHRSDVFERKSVVAVVLRHASLEVFSVSGSNFDKLFLTLGPTFIHSRILPRGGRKSGCQGYSTGTRAGS
jgi:hypothetical protein